MSTSLPLSRYVAFLRGVSPMNAKMPELKRCFERAGFTEVRTVISSGNVVFNSPLRSVERIERQAEAAMVKHLGQSFYTIVRSVEALRQMLTADPYAAFTLAPEAKRVVTFARTPRQPARPLPLSVDSACMLTATGRELFSFYVPSPRGPVFMALIEKTFGKDVTTRTWDTVKRCLKA